MITCIAAQPIIAVIQPLQWDTRRARDRGLLDLGAVRRDGEVAMIAVHTISIISRMPLLMRQWSPLRIGGQRFRPEGEFRFYLAQGKEHSFEIR